MASETISGTPAPASFNPADFMRARHPDMFSDTEVEFAPELSRPLFEYHLETLTSRKQEERFEYFCRLLAEKEICPNLRPQTGPTGGGDSKVDTETYPISPDLAERWFVGEQGAARERWAFAFSAKKAWKTKVKSDVASIASTGRDYKRIYFITNQFARDKDRAKLEDSLSAALRIPVHILDRAWIVEKVFENNRFELAIQALGITGLAAKSSARSGPRDTARKAELDELDRQIADAGRYEGTPYQLAEDCLRSAILARGLECSRAEIEGRFARAERIAQRIKQPQQLLRIAYNRAWTAFWWHSDFAALNQLYDDVEQYAKGSAHASDIELVLNLWQLLGPSILQKYVNAEDARVNERRDHLVAELERLAADGARPNNALQAKTSLCLIRLNDAWTGGRIGEVDQLWADFHDIVSQADDLGNYPVECLFRLISEMGEHMSESPAFDKLFEEIVALVERRRSEGEGGKAYINRAFQKLKNGRPYEAIRLFGRAEDRLIKEEYREDLVIALVGASLAYERVGLLWAARNKVLAATERTLVGFLVDGVIISPTLRCSQRLVWLELQLGRVPHVLAFMELAAAVAFHLRLSEGAKQQLSEERENQELVLGILLLNTRLADLSKLEALPSTFESLRLGYARMALLYALGHEDALRAEEYIPLDQNSAEVIQFFSAWNDQPAKKDLPEHPDFQSGDYAILRSVVLGCEVVMTSASGLTSVCIAESVLGALEAFLATSLDTRVVPFRERLAIEVAPSRDLEGLPQLTFLDAVGEPQALISHPVKLSFTTKDDFIAYGEWLRDVLAEIICRIAVIDDPEGWIERIAGEERGLSRAISLGNVATLTENVLGPSPKLRLKDWIIESDAPTYALQRSQLWNAEIGSDGAHPAERPLKPGRGLPPEGLFDVERLKHSERRVFSVINIPLWDKARWGGTVFAHWGEGGAPPILALAFADSAAGRAIFEGWRTQFGEVDSEDALRISIITGLSTANPYAYAVVVSRNIDHKIAVGAGGTFVTVSRINRMEPSSSENLDRFLRLYRSARAYFLAPAQFSGAGTIPELFPELRIGKRKLEIRPAWQIDENDPDMSVLDNNDDPIVPDGVLDAPVFRALKRIRSFRK